MLRTHTRGTPRKKKESKKIGRRSRRAFLPSFRELVHNLTCDLARGTSTFDQRAHITEALQIKLMMVSALLNHQRPRTLRELSHWFTCLDSVLADYHSLRYIWETEKMREAFGGRIL